MNSSLKAFSFLSILCCLLLSSAAFGQSGTIDWPTACPTQNCPGTYTDPNGVQVTVTSTFGTGTGAPQGQTTLVGTTAGALGIAPTTTATPTTPGLGIQLDYGTPSASPDETGNLYTIAFDRPLEGLSIPLYDLTSPSQACNAPGNGAAVYNDEVVVTGVDENGAVINAQLTQLAMGYWINGSGYFSGNSPQIQSETYSIVGNTAFVTGGVVNNTGSPNVPNLTGIVATSMDVLVSFPVAVTEIRILYRNNQSPFLGSFTTTAACGSYFSNGNMNPQAILFGNLSYTGIIEPTPCPEAQACAGTTITAGQIAPTTGFVADNYQVAGTDLTIVSQTAGGGYIDANTGYRFGTPTATTDRGYILRFASPVTQVNLELGFINNNTNLDFQAPDGEEEFVITGTNSPTTATIGYTDNG